MPNVVGVKEASFNRQISVNTHILIGHEAIVSTPDEWILFEGRERGFQQQVMFANTSDWRFDRPGENNYVRFIERATEGDIDDAFYDARIRPIKALSDEWWQRTVKKHNGALPVSLCKAWGEMMGMAGGHVRPPLPGLEPDERAELSAAVDSVLGAAVAAVGDMR